jgi:hypothetical protein
MDRRLRVIAAIGLFLAGFLWFDGVYSIIAYVLAVVLFITGATGFCALYEFFGISTCKLNKK